MSLDQETPQPDTTGVSAWQRAVRFERGIYVNLYRWVRRRPDNGPPGSVAVPYVGLVRTTLYLWIGASAVEMVAVHFLVPWPWLRWPLLVVSIWGLLWMVGLLAGLIVHPHLVEPETIRVRYGHTIDAHVPIDRVDLVRTYTKSLMSSRAVSVDEDDPGHVYIAVSGQVNIHLTLSDPVVLELPRGRYTITRLSFWADDPSSAMTALRSAITG